MSRAVLLLVSLVLARSRRDIPEVLFWFEGVIGLGPALPLYVVQQELGSCLFFLA